MKGRLSLLLMFYMFFSITLVTNAQTIIKEKVKITNNAQDYFIEEWDDAEFYYTEEVQPGSVLTIQVGHFNYAHEFMPYYFHPRSEIVIEFSIIDGSNFCSFIDKNGNLVSGSLYVEPDGYLNVKLKLNNSFNFNGAGIELNFAACNATCVSFSMMKSMEQNNSTKENSKLASVSCPEVPDCGYQGVPALFHCSGTTAIIYEKEEDCSDAPQCDGEQIIPNLDYIELPLKDGYCKNDEKRRGGFAVEFSDLFVPPNMSICYNNVNDKWQININQITLKYRISLCEENIRNRYKAIYDYDILEDSVFLPNENLCQAYKDFNSQRQYGGGAIGHYFIVDVVKQHEQLHKIDFQKIAGNLFTENDFPGKIISYGPKCDEINNQNEVVKNSKKYFEKIVKDFIKELKKRLYFKVGQPGSEKRKDYENDVQKNKLVQHLIDSYYTTLLALRPEINPATDCN